MRKVIENIVIVVLTSGITLLASDLGLRLLGNSLFYYRPHERYIRVWPDMPQVERYVKNVNYADETYGDLAAMLGDKRLREKRRIVFKTDSFGFRNEETNKSHETYDLIVLGDSFGVGNGTTQEHTWVQLLNSIYGLRVYNLSIPGSPWQAYVNFTIESKRLKTHTKSVVLLCIFPGNDLDDYYPADSLEIKHLPWNSPAERLALSLRTFWRRSPLRQLVKRFFHGKRYNDSVLERDLTDGRRMLFYRPYALLKNRTESDIRNHPNYEKLIEVIDRMETMAAERGAALILLLIPSKEEIYSWILDQSDRWRTDEFSSTLDKFCKQKNLSLLDLKPFLMEAAERRFKEKGQLLWWTDDTHWNEAGHKVVADTVYQDIFERLHLVPNRSLSSD